MGILTPHEMCEKAILVGVKKAEMPSARMVLLGTFAGAFIALAGVAARYYVSYRK